MSIQDISNRSGMSYSTIIEVGAGRCERIYRITEESILGVEPPGDKWNPIGDSPIDVTGSRRRLQALAVQGFSLSFLREKTGLARSYIGEIRSGPKKTVMVSRFRLVRDVHDEFWDIDPVEVGLKTSAVVRMKTWAEKNKWLPTEAWDDIDDPNCKPTPKTPRYVALTEDYQELIQYRGNERSDVAKRLGAELNTIERAVSYYNSKAS